MQFIKSVSERLVSAAALIALALYATVMLVTLTEIFVRPLAPLITAAVALFCTITTFISKKTGVMASVGIALFCASWPITHNTSAWIGLAVYAVGLGLWLFAVILAFKHEPQHQQQA